MRLRILGPVDVESPDGSTETVDPPREQIVVTTLAMSAPDAVSTGHLIDVLWGDSPPPTAAATLKSLVHRIRRRHGASLIATVSGGYRLGQVDTDVVEARAFAEAGASALAGGDAMSAVDRFERALACFRGPPVAALASSVPGRALASEIDMLRQRLVEDLTDARLATGAGSELLGELEAAVVSDPLAEASWGRLMVALYRTGRQAAALGAYQRARNALVEGAGIEPGSGLRELEQRIIDQDPELLGAWPPSTITQPRIEPRPRQGLISDLAWVAADSLLVGRAAELTALTDAITSDDGKRLVLVSGDAGMGKTRLAAEAVMAASTRGVLVLYGRCEEGSPAPFRPFSTAIGRFVDINPPELVEPMLGPAPELVARLVPTLRDAFAIAPASAVDQDEDLLRSFDVISRMLDEIGSHGGAVLVLDDLHWATAPTVRLLNHLVSAHDSGVTIIGTFRPRDLTSGHPFAAALAPLHRNPQVSSIRLDRLGGDDIQRYIEHTTGQHVSAGFVDQIAATTGGVPYLLTSTLSFLTDSEGIVRRSGRWELRPDALGSLPAGVKHLVGEQLARLDAPAVTYLRVAAIAGSEFDIAVVAEVAGLDLPSALDAIEAAEFAGLVRELGYGRWTWGHDLARSVVLGEVSTTRAVQAHWGMAEALLRRPRIDYDDVALHATEGLLAAPGAVAATILRDAGEDALDRSPDAALAYANTGLEALDRSDEDSLLRASLLTLRAITTFETSDDPDSVAVEEAMIAAEQASLKTGDAGLIVRAHTLEGRYPGARQFFQFDDRRVQSALNALDHLPTEAVDQRAILLGHLAELHFYDWDSPSRQRVIDELLSMLDGGALTATSVTQVERSLSAFTTVSPDGETQSLRDRQRSRVTGSRHNNPAGPDSRDYAEGTEGSLDMRRLEVDLTNGRFQQVADRLAGEPDTAEQRSLSDQISMLRIRCILAGVQGDVDVLTSAVAWIDRGAPRPRFRSFLKELRRELLYALARVTGVDHGGAAAFEQALLDPKSAKSYRLIHQLAICSEHLLLGDEKNASAAYRLLEADWVTGRASRSLPGVVGVLAADPTSQFGGRDEMAGVKRMLEPLSGTWAVVPIGCLGPVDLALAIVTAGMAEDPSTYLARALATAQASGSPVWEAEVRRTAEAIGRNGF